MMNRSTDKRPLCRFKENCKNYKEGNCQYSHALCRFGENCTKSNCPYTHDKNRNTSTAKTPVSKVPCKFGAKCAKVLKGECHFNHDIKPENKEKKACRFGINCKNLKEGKCPFAHVDDQHAQMQSEKQQMTERTYTIEEEICPDFIFSCCSEEQCKKRHCFVSDNSLKRICYNESFNFSEDSCWKIMKIGSHTVYVCKQNRILSFFSLDEKARALRDVSEFQLYEKQPMNKLFLEDKNIFYVLTTDKKLCLFRYLHGTLDRIEGDFDRIVGVSELRENVFVVATSSQLQLIDEGRIVPQFSNNIRTRMAQKFLKTIKFLRKYEALGETFLMVGFEEGGIMFLNSNLQEKIITFPGKVPADGCSFVFQHHPYSLVALQAGDGVSQIYSIDLVSFSQKCVLKYKCNDIRKKAPFKRICQVYNKVFVGIDEVGVFVYKLPNFKERLGSIVISGKINQIETQPEGNLLILEEVRPNKKALSIYKVRND